MKRGHQIGLLGIGLLLLAVGVAWAFLGQSDEDLAQLRSLESQLRETENLPEDQRNQLFQEVRTIREGLTDEQRRAYGQERRQEFQNRMRERITGYFELPEEKRVAYLDAEIDRMEERRAEWETRRQQREANGPGADRSGPPGMGPRGGPRPGGPPDEERRAERRRRMLDATSPEDRAMFVEYMEDIMERREERGLPEFRRGPFR